MEKSQDSVDIIASEYPCIKHNTRLGEFYCESCKSLFCLSCVRTHKKEGAEHKLVNYKNYIADVMEELDYLNEDIGQKSNETSVYTSDIKAGETIVKIKLEHFQSEFNKAVEKLKKKEGNFARRRKEIIRDKKELLKKLAEFESKGEYYEIFEFCKRAKLMTLSEEQVKLKKAANEFQERMMKMLNELIEENQPAYNPFEVDDKLINQSKSNTGASDWINVDKEGHDEESKNQEPENSLDVTRKIIKNEEPEVTNYYPKKCKLAEPAESSSLIDSVRRKVPEDVNSSSISSEDSESKTVEIQEKEPKETTVHSKRNSDEAISESESESESEDDDSNKDFPVYIKTLTGNTSKLITNGEETVAELKKKVCEKLGVPENTQKLVFAGIPLVDEKNIGGYRITDGSTIHLIQILRGC